MQVTGDSIFNLLALADVETDKDDRPVYPQKILSVEVPFFLSHVTFCCFFCSHTYLHLVWVIIYLILFIITGEPKLVIYSYVSFLCVCRFSGTHLRI